MAMHGYLVPFLLSHEVEIPEFSFSRFCEFCPSLFQSDQASFRATNAKLLKENRKFPQQARLTAFDTIISSPPNPSVASCTILSQSSRMPVSWTRRQRASLGNIKSTYTLKNNSLDFVFLLYILSHPLSLFRTCIIVDRNIRSFNSELFRDNCA